jgi:glycosyltransferase involved in cell wall biosynthesis
MNKQCLYITDEVQISGTTPVVRGISEQLFKRGYTVDLLTFRDPSKQKIFSGMSKKVSYTSYEINSHFSLKTLPIRVLRIFLFLQKKSYSFVLCDMFFCLIPIWICKALLQGKKINQTIFVFHGSYYLQLLYGKKLNFFDLLKINFEFALYGLCDKVVCFSTYSRNVLISNGVPKEKILLTHPGISNEYTVRYKKTNKSKIRESIGISANSTIFLTAGRIEKRKGILELVKYFTQWSKNKQDILLFVLSDYDESGENIFRALNSTGLQNNVHFIHKPDKEFIAKIITATDCVLVPSLDLETFGFITLEALSANSPVVAFKIGANSELLNSSSLVTLNKKNYKNSFNNLLNLALRNSKKKNNVYIDLDKFSWSQSCEKMLNSIKK